MKRRNQQTVCTLEMNGIYKVGVEVGVGVGWGVGWVGVRLGWVGVRVGGGGGI